MAERSELLDYVIDALTPLGHARARSMFGGYGLYLDGLITGIIAWDMLYLKVDDGNRADYESAGSQPFTYDGRGKPIAMSYWEVPAEIIEDPERLRDWALRARAASARARGPAPGRGRRVRRRR
jgi:DNA transformation protein